MAKGKHAKRIGRAPKIPKLTWKMASAYLHSGKEVFAPDKMVVPRRGDKVYQLRGMEHVGIVKRGNNFIGFASVQPGDLIILDQIN